MSKEEKNKKAETNFTLKSFGNFLSSFLNERFRFLAFLIVGCCLAFLIILWYNYIFHSDWSEAEVQNYIQTKQAKNDVTFNQGDFQEIIDEFNNRKAESERNLNNLPDIFRLKK